MGRQLYQRVTTPLVVWGVAPSGVEIAVAAAEAMKPAHVVIQTAVSTKAVQVAIRTRRWEFVCPSVVMNREGHQVPFGDFQDPSAERLRSIVVARQAA